jgi:hypothetical protein
MEDKVTDRIEEDKILKLSEAAEQVPWTARRLRDYVSLTKDPKKLHVSQPGGTIYYVRQSELDRFKKEIFGG